MEKLWNKLLYAALGASSGLTGLLAFTGCPGSACLSCFGCAGAGVGAALSAFWGFKRKQKEVDHGMA